MEIHSEIKIRNISIFPGQGFKEDLDFQMTPSPAWSIDEKTGLNLCLFDTGQLLS